MTFLGKPLKNFIAKEITRIIHEWENQKMVSRESFGLKLGENDFLPSSSPENLGGMNIS